MWKALTVVVVMLAGVAIASVPESEVSPTALRELCSVYVHVRLMILDLDDPGLTKVIDGKAVKLLDPKLAVQRPDDLCVSLLFRHLRETKPYYWKVFSNQIVFSGSSREFPWPTQIPWVPHILPEPTPEEVAKAERFVERHQLRVGAEVNEDAHTARLQIRYRLWDRHEEDKVEVFSRTVTIQSKQAVVLKLPFKAADMLPPVVREKGGWDDCEVILLIQPQILPPNPENGTAASVTSR